jgi:amidase
MNDEQARQHASANSAAVPADPFGCWCRDNHAALAPTGHGVLDGLTFAAKDVFDIAGTRTGFGNPDWLASHAPATRTAAAVARLLAAGARLVGRTQTDELTYSLNGENPHYGTPINPAAPARIPGGSSSGSAVAVAAGLVDFALGTDCGGSVRIPASYCGVLGLRPSHGRLSVAGVIPFAPSFDVVGWFARDAEIFEKVGALLCGVPPVTALPERVLFVEDAFALLTHAVRTALGSALERLSALLAPPHSITLSRTGLRSWFEVFRIVQGAEIWAARRDWIAQRVPHIGAAVNERLTWAAALTEREIGAARAEQQRIGAHVRALLTPGTVLCLPTAPRCAPWRGTPPDLAEHEYRAQAMSLLCIAGLAGLPQVSMPLATLDGLPLGLSLIGAPGSDMQLLAVARRLLTAS